MHEAEVVKLIEKDMINTCKKRRIQSRIATFTYDKWVLELLENLLLVFDMVDMLAVDNFLLLHGLNGELVVSVVFQPCELDISKGA